MSDSSVSPLRLTTPPITKAIVSFNCPAASAPAFAGIETAAREKFAETYPVVEQLNVFESSVEFRPDADPALRNGHRRIGLRLANATPPTQLIQFLEDGFTFNRLRPYSGFDDYLKSISEGWDFYRSFVAPPLVSRMALRYINRVDIPHRGEPLNLADFFTMMPAGLPVQDQDFLGMFQTFRFRCRDTGASTQITLATQAPDPIHFPVIVDIDVFLDVNLPTGPMENFIPTLRALRTLKNTVFRTSLTDKCLSLFQPLP